eukprot:g12933.t1
MSNILRGLAFIHKNHVLHRDVTDGNLLVADEGRRVVLADFDLSVQTIGGDEQVPWTCGTPGFVAPEVLRDGRGCRKSDVFSAGVVAFLIACGKHPFWREDLEDVQASAKATLEDEPNFWGGRVLGRSFKCLDFLSLLLQKQVDDRLSASEALCHPWLSSSTRDLCAAVERFNNAQSDVEEGCVSSASFCIRTEYHMVLW